jgi:hypothetical protein
MLLENAFQCTYADCILPAMITLVITLLLMIGIHVYIYYIMVGTANSKYGSQPLPPAIDIDSPKPYLN